ncbi:MAG: hypothetical protein PHC43_00840 [Candidatus Marinimicrobia bacterium]|jgi:hypothetical protein|nr:hypothetical protein [Candidatus Neomarinimicrobiota bacterium]MDD5229854.1 hypothetical protein [Candidatus Neomarinimicrobiota bacterium]MDD5539500.1 hypothetical protein [Candidatus Neomarinimicrobiota bacterium]
MTEDEILSLNPDEIKRTELPGLTFRLQQGMYRELRTVKKQTDKNTRDIGWIKGIGSAVIGGVATLFSKVFIRG